MTFFPKTKNELKNIFINNYSNVYKFPLTAPLPGITLNNNQTYQCFRNASMYFLYRMQNEIWDNIDVLRTDISNITTFTDAEFNQYLIIQTMIELMDDAFINTLYTSDSIETKRTKFLDSRLELLKDFTHKQKYDYGLLRNHRRERNDEIYRELSNGDATEEASLRASVRLQDGGISREFINNFITIRRFLNLSIDFTNNISSNTSNSNYIIVNVDPKIDISSFIVNKNNYVDKKNSKNEYYKLVGILYDCPDGVAHQVASVCFACDCDLPTPTHIFMDDHTKKVMKLDSTFNKNNLTYGCETDKTKVDILLYEKVTVRPNLQDKINQYLTTQGNATNSFVAYGGGFNYEKKYIKYKNKYLSLKKLFNSYQ